MKILMVCLGNICRSPLAEGILRQKIEAHGLDWEVDSAGTGNWHAGEAPDPRSQAVAKKYSIDISNQRARTFQPYDLEVFDRIYVMDSSNYNDVVKQAQNPEEVEKVKLILNEAYPGENRAVPDPYWDDDGFEQVYQMLDKACSVITTENTENH
jgi:protein-tyrosine phosphatase